MTATRSCTFGTLRLSQEGRVLTVRYVSPPQNFMTTLFLRDLDRLTTCVASDPTIGAVVLTGGIEGRFLTHLDARELGDIQSGSLPQVGMRVFEYLVPILNLLLRLPGMAELFDQSRSGLAKGMVLSFRWKRALLRMNRSGVVYIAAINGPALDGGLEIALACDVRYAADSAHIRISQSEMLVGVPPGGGGSQRLLRILGTARAMEHILEGRPLTAAESHELGLVHRVVPEKKLVAEAQATAARFARRSPTAVAALKQCLYFGQDLPFGRSLDRELAGFAAAGLTRGARRALQAYLEDFNRAGDTPFLVDPEPWIEGTRVDLIS